MAKYYNLVALNIVIIFLFFTLPILSALFIVLLSPLVNTGKHPLIICLNHRLLELNCTSLNGPLCP